MNNDTAKAHATTDADALNEAVLALRSIRRRIDVVLANLPDRFAALTNCDAGAEWAAGLNFGDWDLDITNPRKESDE